jgi:hypothetical protein
MKHLFFICILASFFKNVYSQQEELELPALKQKKVNRNTIHEYYMPGVRNALGYHSYTREQYDDQEFGSNLITLYPISYSKHDWNDTNDNQDIGISYERISNNGKFGFKIPIYYSLSNKGIYVNPVFKLYAHGQGVFRYALGPQFVIGTQKVTLKKDNPSTWNIEYESVDRAQFGIMFNILYNSPKLDLDDIGLEFLLGPIVLVNPSFSFGISTGFRF